MVNEVMQDPELALETHAREELGITPQSLGSPWQAAAASFVTFALGAFIPLAPWLFTSGTTAIVLSVVLAAVASLVGRRRPGALHRAAGAGLRPASVGGDRGGRRRHVRGGQGDRHRRQLSGAAHGGRVSRVGGRRR